MPRVGFETTISVFELERTVHDMEGAATAIGNICGINSMVWVRERTIQTKRPPIVGEVIVNFCG
jgi:hypothetical protein